MIDDDGRFMLRAIALSEQTALVESAGGAVGWVLGQAGAGLAAGGHRGVAEHAPPRPAEIAAIRNACRAEASFKLRDATLYSSAEPCPMCMAAAYWAGIKRICYAATNEDARLYGGFDDSLIYQELTRPAAERLIPSRQILRAEALEVWKKYQAKPDRVPY